MTVQSEALFSMVDYETYLTGLRSGLLCLKGNFLLPSTISSIQPLGQNGHSLKSWLLTSPDVNITSQDLKSGQLSF